MSFENQEEDVKSDEEVLDPVHNACHKSIEDNLEKLTAYGIQINELEAQITLKRSKFDKRYAESRAQLASLEKKIGTKDFRRARKYFDLIQQKNQRKVELDNIVVQFKRALSVHESAKNTLAELTLSLEPPSSAGEGCCVRLEEAVVETLGSLNEKVGAARDRVDLLTSEHARLATNINELESLADNIRRDSLLTRMAIAKTEPLYRMKWDAELVLTRKRDKLLRLQRRRRELRLEYQAVMQSLETISGELHAQRAERQRDRHLRRLRAQESSTQSLDSVSLNSVSTISSVDIPISLEIGRFGGSQYTEGSEASSTDTDDVQSSYDFEEVQCSVAAVSVEDGATAAAVITSRHTRCGSTSSTGSGQIVCRNICSVTDSPLAQPQHSRS